MYEVYLLESLHGGLWILDPPVRRLCTRLPHDPIQTVDDTISGRNVTIRSLGNLYSVNVKLDWTKTS
jgi:hypothetical protein